jgi:hypothetical protein
MAAPPPRPTSRPPDRNEAGGVNPSPSPATVPPTNTWGSWFSSAAAVIGTKVVEGVREAAVNIAENAAMQPITKDNVTEHRRHALRKALRAAYLSTAIYKRGNTSVQTMSDTLGGELLHCMLQENDRLATTFVLTTATKELHPQDFTELLSNPNTIPSDETTTSDPTTEGGAKVVELESATPIETKVAAQIARATGDKTLYIVFRGSSSLRDWVVNFTAYPTPLSLFTSTSTPSPPTPPSLPPTSPLPVSSLADTLGVHMGMQQTLDVYYHTIRDKLESFLNDNPDFELVLTGHSLGGGYATLLYLKLQLEKHRPTLQRTRMSLFTFGAPAVLQSQLMEDEFLKVLKGTGGGTGVDLDSMHMFVNGSDIVPRLLGTNLTSSLCSGLGYSPSVADHAEKMKHFKHAGNYYIFRNDALFPCDRPSAACKLPPLVGIAHAALRGSSIFISDHSMRLYLSKLQEVNNSL